MAERTTPGNEVALTIAGSDCSGGAGVQADLKVFAVMGVYGTSAITAVTAQNTTGVKHAMLLEPELVEQQIDAVAGDIEVDACKTGMLGNSAIIEAVVGAVKRQGLFPLVVDPVMISKHGDALIDEDAVKTLCKKLLPLAAIVTPNLHEAALILGRDAINDEFGASEASREICKRFGAKACIVKGIKRDNEHEGLAVDFYFDGSEVHEVVSDWRPTRNVHGSGCTFSAAITGALALGEPIEQAVQTGKAVVSEAIRQATDLGQGVHPVNHLAYAKVKK